ncbi:heat shock protein HspQ [Zavarzinia sp. CC-PAN008]|uniref:heat shock protein HspQ n=1 Tax=Zavarzinia sp. CC-PAN008 TaxID=3243332 RepID=UPI003F745C39
MTYRIAKFPIGQIVRHRIYPFRGVVVDVDPVFSNTEEWYQSIPADRRPAKDQPYYHVLAQNAQGHYEAYVSEQNLVTDDENGPVSHPMVEEIFSGIEDGRYRARHQRAH